MKDNAKSTHMERIRKKMHNQSHQNVGECKGLKMLAELGDYDP